MTCRISQWWLPIRFFFTFISEQFHSECPSYYSAYNDFKNYSLKINDLYLRGQWHKMAEISQKMALRDLSWTKYAAFWGKFVIFSRKAMTLFTWHIYVSLGLEKLAFIILSHCNYCPICTTQIQALRSNDQQQINEGSPWRTSGNSKHYLNMS